MIDHNNNTNDNYILLILFQIKIRCVQLKTKLNYNSLSFLQTRSIAVENTNFMCNFKKHKIKLYFFNKKICNEKSAKYNCLKYNSKNVNDKTTIYICSAL